jgi:hypothetical protein
LTVSTSNPVTAARCSGVHPPARARIIAPRAFPAGASLASQRDEGRHVTLGSSTATGLAEGIVGDVRHSTRGSVSFWACDVVLRQVAGGGVTDEQHRGFYGAPRR